MLSMQGPIFVMALKFLGLSIPLYDFQTLQIKLLVYDCSQALSRLN